MAEVFHPATNILVHCRFCKKVMPAQLDRSIACNGKTVDRNSTFEYTCSKCERTFCFPGTDLTESQPENAAKPQEREYSPKQHYLIGDVIYHKKFKERGNVVNKEPGATSCIVVHFEKSGMRKLVETAFKKEG